LLIIILLFYTKALQRGNLLAVNRHRHDGKAIPTRTNTNSTSLCLHHHTCIYYHCDYHHNGHHFSQSALHPCARFAAALVVTLVSSSALLRQRFEVRLAAVGIRHHGRFTGLP
jgi:hypothetical protein